MTTTVAVQVTVPPAPVAVSRYAVVTLGETVVEPEAIGETTPMPLSIDADVASVVVQESVEEPPERIGVGEATSVQDGVFGFIVTVTVAVQVTVPPAPVAAMV